MKLEDFKSLYDFPLVMKYVSKEELERMYPKRKEPMTPGRELDALVAEKVMGWARLTWAQHYPDNPSYADRHELTYGWHDPATKEMVNTRAEESHDYYNPEDAWSPSTDITAAWQVVEELGNQRHRGHFRNADSNYAARALFTYKGEIDEGPGLHYEWSEARTMPHAICLAALKAVGVEV